MRLPKPFSFARHFHAHSELSLSLHQCLPNHARLSLLCSDLCRSLRARNVLDEFPDSVSRASRSGKSIHAHALILGLSSNGFLGNAIVDLYAKCGEAALAGKAFDRLDYCDVFAWNSILSLQSKYGSPESVFVGFAELLRSGVSPNGFTFAAVLSTCARLADVEFGRRVHCCVVKMGFESDSYCEGAVVNVYAKCDQMIDARRAFDAAKKMDTVSWTAMITGYVRAGSPDRGVEVFKEMKNSGLVPDQVAYITAITACVSVKKLAYARELFNEMPKPNVVAWNVMISGHNKAGCEEDALMFYVGMRKAGEKPSRSTLGSVLSAISTLGALEYGLLIHAHAVKQGFDSNFYVGSSLINMYAKCERVDASKKVFNAMEDKNVVLWNAMLGGYAQNRYSTAVIELFFSMKGSGVQPDEFTYTSVLSACSCSESLELGRQFHSVIIKNKLSSNLFVGNALIDMYAKSGALVDAKKQFERIGDRDNVSWNAIIVGFVREEDETEAFDVFRRMISHGTMPDEVSLASISSACANQQTLKKGQQVHCFSVKTGFETSLYSGSSLVDMYAKCGSTESARSVFSSMPYHGVVAMNALISGYTKANLVNAIALFREMQALGLSPTDITFASLLDAFDGPEFLALGRQIHGSVLKRAFLYGDCDFLRVSLMAMYMNSRCKLEAETLLSEFPNPKSPILWTAMISGLTQTGFSEHAWELYSEMRSDNVKPDQAAFASVLRACSLLSSLPEGREVHSLVFRTGFDADELTCSALVDMYAKCGDVESSTRVFREMGTKNDVISWNSMIVGLAKNGHTGESIEVFEEMKRRRIEPDDITFLGVLSACSHAGKVAKGRQIFRSMAEPRADHVACVVDLLGRWGFLQEAEALITELNRDSDPMIWNALLGSCKLHGDEVRGERAAKKLMAMEPGSSSPYVLLSNIYAAAGNWEEVNALRLEMRERRVSKSPGCSWIAVAAQKTHVFVAGDESHPCVAEIHGVLECLVGLMRDPDGFAEDMDTYEEPFMPVFLR